jgi:hypothetical protein
MIRHICTQKPMHWKEKTNGLFSYTVFQYIDFSMCSYHNVLITLPMHWKPMPRCIGFQCIAALVVQCIAALVFQCTMHWFTQVYQCTMRFVPHFTLDSRRLYIKREITDQCLCDIQCIGHRLTMGRFCIESTSNKIFVRGLLDDITYASFL